MVSSVLVVGHLGQDGSLLRRSLAKQSIPVVGVGRDVIHRYSPSGALLSEAPRLASWDDLLAEVRPQEIYYLAANHSSSEGDLATSLSADKFQLYFSSNVSPYVELLDAVSSVSPESRLFFASSSQVFGGLSGSRLSEASPYDPTTLYGMAKVQSTWMSRKYREEHGLHIAVGILFNHESHLRSTKYLSSRIVRGALSVAAGEADVLEVGSLQARVDWSLASDFVEGFQLAIRQNDPLECVFASGEKHSVGEFVEVAFSTLGLDWRRHVREKPELVKGVRRELGDADPSRLRDQTGWSPSVSFVELVEVLVQQTRRSAPSPDEDLRGE